MPSRLRYVLTHTDGTRIAGAAAARTVTSLKAKIAAALGRRPTFAELDRAGTRRRAWGTLEIYRERRGLKNADSQYHRRARRIESDAPHEFARRQLYRITQQVHRRLEPSFLRDPAEIPDNPPAPAQARRPGIFA